MALVASCGKQASLDTVNLRCELLHNPRGIDDAAPRLSWEVVWNGREGHTTTNERGIHQKAYRILVASSLEKLNAGKGDLWDSKKVKSNASVNVPYGGTALESRAECYWKVKVTTNRGRLAWSKSATWSMGLLDSTEWQAKWTGLDKSFPNDVLEAKSRLAARYFRKEFDVTQKPVKATVYICGLGLYKLFINGTTIGEQELAPTPTDYTKVVKYNTFDVIDEITRGINAIGVTLGNGRFFSVRPTRTNVPTLRHFGFPKMIVQLELTFADGSRQTVVSDDSWRVTADGPIRANNEFDGEEYDATMEMPGWNAKGFDDSAWMQAELVEAPEGALEAQRNLNIKVMETIRPVGITQPQPDTYILDMGQNMVGWLAMRVKGKAGDQVKLRFAEVLQEDGTLFLANLRGALVTDLYTLKGGDAELFEPVFTYHGFRFVEVTGYPGTPTLDDFVGKVLYDEMEVTGTFETSNETLNQIYQNACWGILGNYRGMPTDCPQRDERMGWLGDRAVGLHGESFLFGVHNLYAKWLDDIAQSQREDGCIPDVAPNYWRAYTNNMTWPGAFIIMANTLYEQYGNIEPIVKHYGSMKKWLAYMRETFMKDHIMPKDTYGDWCMPPESPKLIHSQDPTRKTEAAVLGTTFYYRMLFLLEKFAHLLNLPDEAADFAREAVAVKDAYNEKYFDPETAQYSNNTVTANLLSLCFDMVPQGYEQQVFHNIVDKTEQEFDGHVSTGLVGIQWLMRGLSDRGRPDLAFRIATNRTYPSWGYMVESGATTIWELWNGNTAAPSMNSHNHVMLLGDLLVWFYEYLAAIQNAPGSIAFEKMVMRPYPVDGLEWVNASYHSLHGMIKSHWRKSGNTFQWEITIPPNTTATVYIPTTDPTLVTESGKKASSAKSVKFLYMDNDLAVYEIKSGDYSFAAPIATLRKL